MTRVLRESLSARGVGERSGFRWRGGEITRLEGFSDAVFAFAVTLLVVSLEVPHTYNELVSAIRGFLPFAVCFTALVMIWREHYVFFRRYGLQDDATIWLNAALLFLVLFYVHPLKFLFTLVFNLVGLAGFSYFLFLPVMTINGAISGARRRRVEALPAFRGSRQE